MLSPRQMRIIFLSSNVRPMRLSGLIFIYRRNGSHGREQKRFALGKKDFFDLAGHGTNVKTEVIAGITTFLAMAYILAVNPSMLKETGMDQNAVFVATALSAALATFIMAFSPITRWLSPLVWA